MYTQRMSFCPPPSFADSLRSNLQWATTPMTPPTTTIGTAPPLPPPTTRPRQRCHSVPFANDNNRNDDDDDNDDNYDGFVRRRYPTSNFRRRLSRTRPTSNDDSNDNDINDDINDDVNNTASDDDFQRRHQRLPTTTAASNFQRDDSNDNNILYINDDFRECYRNVATSERRKEGRNESSERRNVGTTLNDERRTSSPSLFKSKERVRSASTPHENLNVRKANFHEPYTSIISVHYIDLLRTNRELLI